MKILSFDGTNIRANNDNSYPININDEEEVFVKKEVFNANKNEMILYTSKEVEILEEKKYEAEQELQKLICEYNKQEIEKDVKLLSYCKVHNLIFEYTDVDELKKVVYRKENEPICCGFDLSQIYCSPNYFIRNNDTQIIL